MLNVKICAIFSGIPYFCAYAFHQIFICAIITDLTFFHCLLYVFSLRIAARLLWLAGPAGPIGLAL